MNDSHIEQLKEPASSPSDDETDRNRSVNDFDSNEALRMALRLPDLKAGGFHSVGRDFPAALIEAAPYPAAGDDESMSECSSTCMDPPRAELDWVLTNYNAELSQTQSLGEEMKRLQVLRSYLLLDAQREPSFERLTALASRLFRVPIALVSLVDLGRQWFMSNRGLGDVRETPRKLAFCAHCILSTDDLLIVPDASADPRFLDNPLVTGPPHIRFYAGAPLMCPEGYKLGTLCIIDTKTRQMGLSLEEKQNLRELADLVMDAMVQRRKEKLQILQDKSQIIACTAHDLLTPLSGVQMSLSLLLEDEEDLHNRLTATQKELIITAGSCSDVMNRICQHAIDTFRDEVDQQHKEKEVASKNDVGGPKVVVIRDMVQKWNMVMEPYPKAVPLHITIDDSVPPAIVADDLKIFRSAVNYMTNACRKTLHGSVNLNLSVAGKRKKRTLVVQCIDTGPGVPLELYEYLFRPFRDDGDINSKPACLSVNQNGALAPVLIRPAMSNSGLGLYSVAHQISSIGGEYGFRPRAGTNSDAGDATTGAVFWFSIPLILPQDEIQRPETTSATASGELSNLQSIASGNRRRVAFDLRTMQQHSSSLSSIPDSDTVADCVQPLVETTAVPQETKDLRQQAEDLAERIQNMATTSDSDIVERAQDVKMTSEVPHTPRALVIDDSVVIRKSTHRALTKLGFEMSTASNGLEGLTEMQNCVFDLVLCDFLMPVMDGLDCVQQYRDWEAIHRPWFRQYIVGISAHASPDDAEKGRIAGMDDFRAKPVTLKTLKELQTIEEVVAAGELLDRLEREAKGMHNMGTLDAKDENGHHVKRLKLEGDGKFIPICLVAEDSPIVGKVISETIERRGWRVVVVRDGEDALRLMKTRNWTSVFLEENLPRLTGIRCVERFREWEQENRVARQKNVFLLSDSFVPSPSSGISLTANHPSGFDTVLGKPVLEKDIEELIDVAAAQVSGECAQSDDILPRAYT